MAKVKLDLKGKSHDQLRDFAREHGRALVGNADFPSPLPEPAVFDPAVAAYDEKLEAIARLEIQLQTMRAERDTLRAGVERNLNRRGSYVEGVANGDEATILGAAFQVKSAPTPMTSLPAPQELRAETGRNPGEIGLRCKALARAKSYLCETRTYADDGAPGPWVMAKVFSRCHGMIGGLASGKKYGFRMRALGPNELESPWSAEVIRMAP